ncbi:multidrug efflux RND transporter outer membrane channel subunit OprM [Marinobacter nanhaiticus D15-8W]|uniref:Multidrug transporter n=1 Tax=Marinobacter nanhaiticus D15-8W TaxID=626887 RepID=N6X2I0_9GAMM|nr:efflux transporter outer membrane subunit [Marinobacter nanhaiticus]ENO15258.1 multidrug transporter [Marinobacter nanhaiticus D15-8W]BES69039.1 multidrug efflux RND transporter outer membrane channel subunit OprM [Marinobacter nanhaiticus D15-8W]
MKSIVPTLAAAVILGGCSMIPDYQAPESPVPTEVGNWNQSADQVVLPGWESLFPDPQLRALIHTALANNRDLRLAMLDVAEARAQYGIEKSALFPEIDANGDGTRQRLPADLSNTGDSTITSQYSVGLGVASYELDLFGRIRSLEQSALQSYLATEEARRSAQITLVSEVANAYLTLLADRQKLRISEDTVESQQESVDLVQRRYDAGLGSELDVRQAQIALETARANRAQFRRLVSQDRNALSVLVSGPVAEIPEEDVIDPAVALLASVPEGLDSSVLLKRPDIQQAEYSLKSANANIGAARAAFYPSITLTGSAGTASTDLAGLFESGSGTWSFSPSINLPIFTAGRLQSNLDVAEIRKEQSVVQYEQAIQEAFQEVSDALAARDFLSEQEEAQAALVDATQRSLELAEARYEGGADDYLAVLDARRELLSARQNLVDVKLGKLTNRITLYRALGGGESADQPTTLGRAPQAEEKTPGA